MRIFGKDVFDTCSLCGDILTCKLFRQGHGIGEERKNVAKMLKCQMDYEENVLRKGERNVDGRRNG